jgi:predicted alpha/beta superfamily hydrolase
MRALLVLALAIGVAIPGGAVEIEHLQSLGDTRYHLLESKVATHTYHVYVRLPESYKESGDQTYPTIYLLDGGSTFPMLGGYYRYLSLGEEIPDLILVGISYGTDDWKNGNNRSHDFTAPSSEREYWGGAADFQKMLRTELLPLIENTYRSDPKRRVIFGQSLGGQFVIFTALTEPALFWGHIASNPALHRNLPFFLEAPKQPVNSNRPKLFVSSGSDDDPRFREPTVKWMSHWSTVKPTPWDLEMRTLKGHNHFSAATSAFRQGLIWLFSTDLARARSN